MSRPSRALLSLAALALLALAARASENRRDDVDSTADAGVIVRQTKRPLLDLVSLAIASGKDTNVNEDLARLLGLRGDYRVRALRVPAAAAPDHVEHAFEVVYRQAKGEAIDPVAILLGVERVELLDGMKHFERRVLRLSLDGDLQNAAAEHGGFKEIERSSMTLATVQGMYKEETSFFQDASRRLPLQQ